MSLVGGIVGMVGDVASMIDSSSMRRERIHVLPLPHHFPKYKDGITLRFAMVHDVLHERYARHGKAYYFERNRRVSAELKTLGGKSPANAEVTGKYFALVDDLGVGLDSLGQHEEAAAVLRDKLQQQRARNYTGRDLYTTYANLGTFLIHGNAPRAFRGDPQAKERLREGLGFIRQAIEVNPEAHFGREIWQAVTVDFLLAVTDDPQLLLTFDLIGNFLTEKVDPLERRPYTESWSRITPWIEDFEDSERSRLALEAITPVGSVAESQEILRTWKGSPVPFDKPTLGIIGMWRLGGGANPHFALALGETMLRVGQRYIAWCAYERAVLLSDRFWPLPEWQEKLKDHCRARQRLIESQLPLEEAAALRPRFEAELAFGQNYQHAYAAYEEQQIAAGASIDDPHFYDAFHAQHEPITSPLGGADRYLGARWEPGKVNYAIFVLFAGILGFTTALLLRLKDWLWQDNS
jgi:hypothetical protein